ncbi:MAG: hypothetical protein VX792_13375 [Candidatus Latescibacterota bacterium]|nr:hypothetical protein [Candidatus Latescibacterota bacterium]
MSSSTDISIAIAEVLDSKQTLRIISSLEGNQQAVRDRDGHVLVRKYGTGNHQLEAAGAVIIDDTANGGFGSPGVIDAAGQVILSKDVYNQLISGYSVRIGGTLYDSTIHTLSNVTIDGDVRDSRIVLGSLRGSKEYFEETKRTLLHLANQRDSISRQVAHDAMLLHKMSASTRFSLNLKVGHFIRHDADGLSLDLSYFYDQIKKEDEEEIRLALNDFFNRGIIGVLSRTNRPYFADSPANLQLFTKIITSLRQLVHLTFKRDMLSKQFKAESAAFGEEIAQLVDPKRRLTVRGNIATGSEVHFSFPLVEVRDDGRTSVDAQAGGFVVRSDGDGVCIVQTDLDGSEKTTHVGTQLQAIEAYIEERGGRTLIRVLPIR